jgi:hypothetical protein
MNAQRFESEELDRDTLYYLRTVNQQRGWGTPGIYLDHKAAELSVASLPGCGALVGLCLLVLAPLIAWGVINHDPLNVAMLLTGLGFLGAWLVIAWVRCLIARARSDYVGYFKYFDPQYYWHASGRGVWVTPLRGLLEARCKHNYSGESGYTRSTVRVVLEDRAFDVSVKDEELAEALELYLNELARGKPGLPIERGYTAAIQTGLYEDADEEVIEAIPEPHKVRSSLAWVAYPVVLVLLAGMFLASYQLCKAWRDEVFWDHVKNKNPFELREYLADQRNTRHRKEAQDKLDAFHQRTANSLQALAGEPALTKGLAEIIMAVKDQTAPVMTVAVKHSQKKEPDTLDGILGGPEASVLGSTMVKKLAEKLSQQLTNLVGAPLGQEIVAIGEPAEGFVMVQIDCRVRRPDERENRYSIVWTVTVQASESAPKQEVRWKQDFRVDNQAEVVKAVRQACIPPAPPLAIGPNFPDQFVKYLRERIKDNEKP